MRCASLFSRARITRGLLVVFACSLFLLGSAEAAKKKKKKPVDQDKVLRKLMQRHGIEPLDPGPTPDRALVELGQALFFDRELSGNRDTACATCHHPFLATGDDLALPVGTGPDNPGAIGHDRIRGDDRELIPRNAPEVFNRGSAEWTSQFWDSRVEQLPNGDILSPAGRNLPGVGTVLAVQAMFPVTSRDEMRGRDGDRDVRGDVNEIAQVADSDIQGIWSALMDRLLAIPEYERLFNAAYPRPPSGNFTFAEAATAIAAFEADAYTLLDSPWDQYVAGDKSALTNQQERGAVLFFGRAKCAFCHNGPLLTDQQHYNIAVPQLGPGKSPFQPLDPGRFLETLKPRDRFSFRTPPLRNVAETGPWMHNGAFNSLRDVIRHHAGPVGSLFRYNPDRQIDQEEVRETVLNDPATKALLIANLDWKVRPWYLNNRDIRDIEAFLRALTAPDLQARLDATVPASVPSGLPVDGTP
jgi:cytochrome c peroxidase